MYKEIYKKLCESNKNRKSNYSHGSGLHKHHIIPTHFGGKNIEANVTYLTVREHKIAHFLLWKINGQINDLRSMHMLGADLSSLYRRKIGIWCKENKIGIHSEEYKNSGKPQKIGHFSGIKSYKNKTGFHNPDFANEYRKLAAPFGGKASYVQHKGIHTLDKEKRREWSSKGGHVAGVASKGKKNWTNGVVNKKCFECPGEDFRIGYTIFHKINRSWFNDGVQSKLYEQGKQPENWKIGRIVNWKSHKSYKGHEWFTNGVKSIHCLAEEAPKGWNKGRIVNSRWGMFYGKGTFWWTNGTINKRSIEQPSPEFRKGQTRHNV